MTNAYSPERFFEFLGYPSGADPYSAPGLRTLSVYCRGTRDNISRLLESTPFEYVEDRFVLQVADFSTATCGAFYDSGVIIPVRYGDYVGANYFFEFEDQSWSVAFGRDVWGYPKQYAEISLEESERSVVGCVQRSGEMIFQVEIDKASPGVDREPWSGFPMYPHLQVHALPSATRRGFEVFEVVARDTSKDFDLLNWVAGPATVDMGEALRVGEVTLEIAEVLGGEFTVGDYACTRENGMAWVIDDLLR